MRYQAFAFIVLLGLLPPLLGGCALFRWTPEPDEYVVVAGDTLYSIAWKNSLDYRDLAAWNGIQPPYLIRPGQVLILEPSDGYTPPRVAPARPASHPPPQDTAAVSTTPLPREEAVEVRPVGETPPDEPVTVATAPPPSAVRWRWPVEGEVVPTVATAGNSGIGIAGSLGQPVRAAAGGRVVYSGSGLQGYGQLVIVKHDDNYLSAYGYNRRLLVRQGDEVHVGQPIAEMGEGPQRRPLLHFEIRRSGRSLDPLLMLPPR